MEESVKNALYRLMKVAVTAKQKYDELLDIGFMSTPFFDMYGDSADAIYYLLGEQTQTFAESVTYDAINHDGLTMDERFSLIVDEYEKNHTK